MNVDIIGIQIKSVAKARGVTQLQLADAIGVTQSFVSALYTGKKIPSLDMLVKLCGYLGTSPNDLLGYSQNMQQDICVSADEMNLLEQYRLLSSRDKETVSVLIDTLSKSSPVKKSLTSLSGKDCMNDSKIG